MEIRLTSSNVKYSSKRWIIVDLSIFLESSCDVAIRFLNQRDHDEMVGLALLHGKELTENYGVIGKDFLAEDTSALILTFEDRSYESLKDDSNI